MVWRSGVGGVFTLSDDVVRHGVVVPFGFGSQIRRYVCEGRGLANGSGPVHWVSVYKAVIVGLNGAKQRGWPVVNRTAQLSRRQNSVCIRGHPIGKLVVGQVSCRVGFSEILIIGLGSIYSRGVGCAVFCGRSTGRAKIAANMPRCHFAKISRRVGPSGKLM